MLWRQRARVTTIREGEQISICIFNEKPHVDRGKIRSGKLKDAEGNLVQEKKQIEEMATDFFFKKLCETDDTVEPDVAAAVAGRGKQKTLSQARLNKRF